MLSDIFYKTKLSTRFSGGEVQARETGSRREAGHECDTMQKKPTGSDEDDQNRNTIPSPSRTINQAFNTVRKRLSGGYSSANLPALFGTATPTTTSTTATAMKENVLLGRSASTREKGEKVGMAREKLYKVNTPGRPLREMDPSECFRFCLEGAMEGGCGEWG